MIVLKMLSVIILSMIIGAPLRVVYSFELCQINDQMSWPKDCMSKMCPPDFYGTV